MKIVGILVYSLHHLYLLWANSLAESKDLLETTKVGKSAALQSIYHPAWTVLIQDHGESWPSLVDMIIHHMRSFSPMEQPEERGMILRIAQGTACFILLISLLATLMYARLIEWLDEISSMGSSDSCFEVDDDDCEEYD